MREILAEWLAGRGYDIAVNGFLVYAYRERSNIFCISVGFERLKISGPSHSVRPTLPFTIITFTDPQMFEKLGELFPVLNG